jgi:signal transduction histidine kinase
LPLTYGHEPVGELILGPRGRGEEFTPADRRLLADIARQVEVAVHAVQVTAALQHSRERLVSAREEERRRLRRDLHDGLGPALASQALALDAARKLLTTDPMAADALLADLTEHTKAAVEDIRRLVYGLRPPALDELGLVAALREQAERYSRADLEVMVEVPERLRPLSAAVDVAVYRIVQEALTNVARHAQATRAHVSLRLDGDHLEVEVLDDGRGILPEMRAGVGLTSMRERAMELGGSCLVEPATGGGTRLVARFPLSEVE